MSEPWEIGEGAGAESGAVGGDSAGDTTLPPPLQPPSDIDKTNPFEPTGGTSTPYPPDDAGEAIESGNMNLEDVFEFDPDDIPPVTEVDYIDANEKETIIEQAKRYIKDKFRNVDFKKLGPIGLGKKDKNKYQLVRYGVKGGEDRIFKKDRSGLLKSFTDKAKSALGPNSEELLAKENQEVREAKKMVLESEKELKEKTKRAKLEQIAKNEKQKLEGKIEKNKETIGVLEEEHVQNLRTNKK